MAWRIHNAQLWWTQLTIVPRRVSIRANTVIQYDSTFFDWVDPWVDTRLIAADRTSWNRLWYYEVDQRETPRNWIRQAVRFAQLAWKIGSGNPRDEQHAAYLFDTDLFVTADKRFQPILELVRRWTITPFANVALMRVPRADDGSVVEEIERVIRDKATRDDQEGAP
jgi:hypothetical protein